MLKNHQLVTWVLLNSGNHLPQLALRSLEFTTKSASVPVVVSSVTYGMYQDSTCSWIEGHFLAERASVY